MKVMGYFYPGWSKRRSLDEWHIVETAKSLFPGHIQPWEPECKYYIEDRSSIRRVIRLVRDSHLSGITFLLYWDNGYLFGDQPIHDFLDELGDDDDLEFSIMWVNRRLHTNFPVISRHQYRYEPSPDRKVNSSFDDVASLLSYLGRFFDHQSYLHFEGRPLLQIYDFRSLFEDLRLWQKDCASKFTNLLGELSFMPTIPDHGIWPWMRTLPEAACATSNYVLLPDFLGSGLQDYRDCCEEVYASWKRYQAHTGLRHIPSIAVGWDPTPRSTESILSPHLLTKTYPRWPVVIGNWSSLFERHLLNGISFARDAGTNLVFLASLNEWSEGHFIERDTRRGDSMAEAVRGAMSNCIS